VRIVHDPEHEYENEFGGFHASSRRRTYGYECKEFTDKLNPIKGALRKNLGRPWNDIYSEFSKVLDRRSNSGIHIFGHLMDFVETNTFLGDDGEIYCYYKWGFRGDLIRRVEGYYVDPITGRLAYSSYDRWKGTGHTRPSPDLRIELTDGTFYFLAENGQWYNGAWRKTMYGLGRVWSTTFSRYVYDQADYEWIYLKACNKKEIRYIKSVLEGRKNEARN
jgi:hypothetical protein